MANERKSTRGFRPTGLTISSNTQTDTCHRWWWYAWTCILADHRRNNEGAEGEDREDITSMPGF
jgi:hypothetical protein